MQDREDARYHARCVFQRMLDEVFPRGAMCAVLEEVDGRLSANRLIGSTGRLLCSDARKKPNTGLWEYELLIDPRRAEQPTSEPFKVWISDVMPNTAVQGLWQADVLDDAGNRNQVLRLNANPPAHVRLSKRARAAVTRAYEPVLFPHGLGLSRN